LQSTIDALKDILTGLLTYLSRLTICLHACLSGCLTIWIVTLCLLILLNYVTVIKGSYCDFDFVGAVEISSL